MPGAYDLLQSLSFPQIETAIYPDTLICTLTVTCSGGPPSIFLNLLKSAADWSSSKKFVCQVAEVEIYGKPRAWMAADIEFIISGLIFLKHI